MTTLIEICRAVADKVQLERPLSVAGSTDPASQRLLALAQDAGDEIMRMYPWQELRKEQTFTALAQETQTSFLPSDFDRFIPETIWDRTNNRHLVGPISPSEWNARKAEASSEIPRRFILRGDAVAVIPIPAGGETYAFEYVSANWCESSGGTGQSAWAADSDVAVIDGKLIEYHMIAAFLEGEGMPAGMALAQFQRRYDVLVGNDQSEIAILNGGDIFSHHSRHYSGVPGGGGNIYDGW